MNSRFPKLYCVYSISFNLSNVGKHFRSWIPKDCVKVLEKKKACFHVLQKTWKISIFSRRSRAVAEKKCTKKRDAPCKVVVLLIQTHCLLIRQVFLITVHAKLRKLRVNYKRPNITSLLSEKKVLANNERCTPRSTCKQWRHRTAAILVHVCLVAAYFVFPDLIRTTLIGSLCLFPNVDQWRNL